MLEKKQRLYELLDLEFFLEDPNTQEYLNDIEDEQEKEKAILNVLGTSLTAKIAVLLMNKSGVSKLTELFVEIKDVFGIEEASKLVEVYEIKQGLSTRPLEERIATATKWAEHNDSEGFVLNLLSLKKAKS